MGSSESIGFLQSLLATKSMQVFRAPFIQIYLDYKWKKARNLIFIKGTMHLLVVLSLLYYLFYSYKIEPMICLCVINTLFLLMETIQMWISIRGHLSNVWSVFDLIDILLIYMLLIDESGILDVFPG